MQIKTKSGRLITMPTPEEDAAITAAALTDPDSLPWTDEQLANLKLKPISTVTPKQTPKTNAELEAWESSRDLAKELEQSVLEMLAGEGKAITIKRLKP